MIKNSTFIKIVFLISPVLLSGCAAMFTSNNIAFPVKTNPDGAQVIATREHGSKKIKKIKMSCVSPCSFELRQDHDYIINITKPNYKPYKKIIHSDASIEGMSGSLGSNLLGEGIFAPIGMGVDAVSGADDRLFPGSLNVKLTPALTKNIESTNTETIKHKNSKSTTG